MHHFSHLDIENRNLHGLGRPDHFDIAVVLFLVQLHELAFFLPVIGRAYDNHDENGNDNSHTLNPLHSCLAAGCGD